MARQAGYGAQPRQGQIALGFSVKRKHAQDRNRVLLVESHDFVTSDRRRFERILAFRKDRSPFCALRRTRVEGHQATAGRVFLGDHIDAVLPHPDDREDRSVALDRGHGARGRRCLRVHHEHVRSHRTIQHLDDQEPIVEREHDHGPVGPACAFAKDSRIVLRIGSQLVKEDVAVVVLLVGGHTSGQRVARVVEAFAGGKPGQ